MLFVARETCVCCLWQSDISTKMNFSQLSACLEYLECMYLCGNMIYLMTFFVVSTISVCVYSGFSNLLRLLLLLRIFFPLSPCLQLSWVYCCHNIFSTVTLSQLQERRINVVCSRVEFLLG